MGSFLIVELEAENRAGEEFGECRLIQALTFRQDLWNRSCCPALPPAKVDR